jgi:ATP-binding cassette subfamily F protein uup
VTHDRYLLDRVSTIVLGLDGQGQVEDFADYSQWELWQDERKQSAKVLPHAASRAKGQDTAPSASKKKLSYLEAREFATIEDRVHEAEQVLQAKRDALEDPAIASDATRLVNAHAEMEVAQDAADKLYARWAELAEK